METNLLKRMALVASLMIATGVQAGGEQNNNNNNNSQAASVVPAAATTTTTTAEASASTTPVAPVVTTTPAQDSFSWSAAAAVAGVTAAAAKGSQWLYNYATAPKAVVEVVKPASAPLIMYPAGTQPFPGFDIRNALVDKLAAKAAAKAAADKAAIWYNRLGKFVYDSATKRNAYVAAGVVGTAALAYGAYKLYNAYYPAASTSASATPAPAASSPSILDALDC